MPSHKHSSRERTPHRMSHYTASHYPDEQMLHFYRWTSPPGVMKILCIIIIIMCVALFVCVASTLAWDYNMDAMGLGGFGMGMGGAASSGSLYGSTMYGGGIGGSYSYGGYGGNYMDPLTGKGFIIGIAAITFIAVLIVFILVVSRQNAARSTRFYLVSAVLCAILALLMLIASIVYLVAVNPTAQTTGSMMYNMIWQLCSQYQNQNQPQTSGLFINQYMYHYCVVEPQEAIAIVLGFLVGIGLIILLVFAVKTRAQMRQYGKHRVLWEEPRDFKSYSQGVEKWVTDVSEDPEALVKDYNDQLGTSRYYLDQTPNMEKPLYLPGGSDSTSTTIMLKSKSRDYDTGAESADELDDQDYDSEFPEIVNDYERLDYKRQFERDHMEYKRLQAELDDINLGLAEVDKELDRLQEGSPQFLDAMDEYTRLKNLKRSADYQLKKRKCKQLKTKLSVLKRRVSDYDRRP